MPEIRIERHGATQVITIANEAKRNAVTHQMERDLLAALDQADAAPEIRVIVVTGAGDLAFSSGHDLNEPLDTTGDPEKAGLAFRRPLDMRKPVIAAVNGHCHAAGFILALACDLRIVSENASFGSPGAKLGMLPAGGQIARLPKLISPARALELMLLGEPMKAAEAFASGLASRMVAHGKALETALDLARRIAANSPAVVRAIKIGVVQAQRTDAAEAARYEASTAQRLKAGPDAKEGVRAFLEKRAPVFSDLS